MCVVDGGNVNVLAVGDLLAVVALEEDGDDDFEEAVIYEELGRAIAIKPLRLVL